MTEDDSEAVTPSREVPIWTDLTDAQRTWVALNYGGWDDDRLAEFDELTRRSLTEAGPPPRWSTPKPGVKPTRRPRR